MRTVLTNLAELADVPVEMDDAVTGQVTLQLNTVPVLDAMRAAGVAVGCEVVEGKADAVLVRPRKAPLTVRRVTFDFANEDVRNVVKALCAYAQASYVLAPDVQGRGTLSVQQTPWRETLDAVLRAVGAHATVLPGDVLLLRRVRTSRGGGKAPPALPITFEFSDEELRNVVGAISGYAHASVVFSEALVGRVSLSVSAVPWPDALDCTLAAASARRIELPGGIILIEPDAPTGAGTSRDGATMEISLRFEGAEVRHVLFSIARFARLNLAMAPDVAGTMDFTAEAEPALACLRRAADAAGLLLTEHRAGVFVVRMGP